MDEKLLQEIDRLVQKQVQPMRTTIASANYRRVAAAALARRLTATLFAECRSLNGFPVPAGEKAMIGAGCALARTRRGPENADWSVHFIGRPGWENRRRLQFDLCGGVEKIVDKNHAHRRIMVSHQRLPDAPQFAPVSEVGRLVDTVRRNPADVSYLAASLRENGNNS